MPDSEQYDRVCKGRLDAIQQGQAEIMAEVRKTHDRLFVGNGTEALVTRVARLEERVTPGSAGRKVAAGSIGLAGVIALVVDRVINYFVKQ